MTTTPEALPQATPGISSQPRSQPPCHVVLLDDDDHTYAYVIEMLRRLFGHEEEKAFRMAREVDLHGRVVVQTTTREHAELKRDQIHGFGEDRRLERSAGPMSCRLEPTS